MTKTVALLPCWSCGSNALHAEQTITDGSITCTDCGAAMVKADLPTAIAQWNTRTQTDQQLREEVERLREVLDIARHELRRQHDGVDFERTKRCRGLIEQLDDALSSSSLSNG